MEKTLEQLVVAKLPYKSKIAGIEKILERNKAFNALPQDEQAKEIALEAIKIALKEGVQASNGMSYWSDNLRDIRTSTALEFQKKLLKVEKCKVCERGLWMFAQIRMSNAIDSHDPMRRRGDYSNIKGVNIENAHDMELEYELNSYNHPYPTNSKGKLINDMCNIMAHGAFSTTDKADYIKKWGLPIDIKDGEIVS